MTTLADRGIAVLRANYDDLAARVQTFDNADLAAASGAREWTVAQVLSHLGSGAEIMRASVEAAIAGGSTPDQDFNKSVWARWDAMASREQADGYLDSAGQLMALMEGLDATARDELRVPLGFLPEPADLTLLTGMRLNEAVLHGWDVRVAADPQAGLTDDEADILIDQLSGPMSFMLGFTARPDNLGLAQATVRVQTASPNRALGLTVAPTAALAAAPDGDVDGVLSGPAEALLRLLAGRYDTARTPDALTLESDTLSLDQLEQVFPGF